MISDEVIRGILGREWGLGDGTRIARHDGGMGENEKGLGDARRALLLRDGTQ